MRKIKEHSLYLIITEEYGRGRSAIEIAECAIAGGVDMIQLREKDKSSRDLIDMAKTFNGLCKKSGVTFIINDNPILAKEIDTDGVHLGQEDLEKFTIKKTRKILGNDKIIGLSTSTIEEVERAANEDIDYIGFGPVFPTKIKDKCVGTKNVEVILKTAGKPVFFIGGINITNNVRSVIQSKPSLAGVNAVVEGYAGAFF